jgi:hypothetical protein
MRGPSTDSFDVFGRDLWQTRRGLNVDVGTTRSVCPFRGELA